MPLSGPERRHLPSCRALQGAEYQLRLSLFDATYHHFFGRTWRSSQRAARDAPPRPTRAAFNEVGCWEAAGGQGSIRAGWVWENGGSPLGRGGGKLGMGGGAIPQEDGWSCRSQVRGGKILMHEGKSCLCSSSAWSRSPLVLVYPVSLVEAELRELWEPAISTLWP